jgi:hypothetical protein
MKIKYLLPILSVPFSTFLVQQSSAENLFVNAGFEDYAPLPNDNVAWDRRGETVTLTRVTSPVQEGTYSLLVDGRNPAQSWNGVRHVVLLLPNQIYRLTGHARMASSTGTLQVKLIKFDDGGVKLPEQLIVDVPGLDNTLFKPFEIYFSFPETNVAETILSFHTLAGSADGEAFLVDNLSLEENPTLLANPGIEATIGSNDWKPRGGTTITPITSPVDEGTYALEVTGRDAGFDGVQQALLGILSQDTVYRISGSLRMVSGAAPDTIKVQLIKNGVGGSPVTVATVANVDDSVFKTFSKTFSFGSEVTTGLELSVGGLTSPTASFIIDGFSIEEVPFDYLTNPDFENDIDTAFNSGWDPRGGTTLTLIPSPVSSGTRALEVTGRDNNFDGVQQKVFGVLSQDTLYRISGDLRMSSGEALDTIKVQLIVNGVGASPITLATVTDVVDSSFTSFATTFSFGAEVTSNLQLAIGGLTSTTASFIADNFSIQAVPPFALLLNPGFEYPIDTNTGKGWDPRGVTAADLVPVSSPVTEGASAIKVINRTGTFNGIKQDMLGTLQPDINYRISGDVRLVGSASDSVEVQLLKEDGINPTVFDPIASATATDTGWTSFANTFTYSETGLVELDLSVHGPASGVDLIIDNLRLERLPELVNPSFEDIPVVDDGLGWDQRGTASLTQVISPTPADGTYAIEVANRTAPFNGVRQSLLPITKPNTLYRISGKVRMGRRPYPRPVAQG